MARREKSRLRAGDVFAQKYVILSVLGEGGMGVVYEAEHTMLAQRVAIKMLKEAARESEEFVKRFGREARASAKLRGVNVARVYDVDILTDGAPYMVMEYLDGHDLGVEMDARGPLPVGEAVGFLLEACSAMAEAHELGIVHRDLKPTNLFFAEQKDGSRILKVLDFGISKSLLDDEVSVTMTQSSLGTPMYMSPEQIRSSKKVDKRTDIWSLGVILYEMLVGEAPFTGESPSAVIASVTADPIEPPRSRRPGIPEELDRVIMKALSKNAGSRHASVEQLAEDLLPFAPRPDLFAPASVRSSPRASFPSSPFAHDLQPTLDARELSDDAPAPTLVTSEARPAVTAEETLVGASEQRRGATQESWTADSASRRGPTRAKMWAAAGGLVLVGAAGYWLATGPSATPRDPEPASAPEEAEQVEAPSPAPPPTASAPEIAPTLAVDAGPTVRRPAKKRSARVKRSKAPPPRPPAVEAASAAPAAPAPPPKPTTVPTADPITL